MNFNFFRSIGKMQIRIDLEMLEMQDNKIVTIGTLSLNRLKFCQSNS